MKKSKKVSVIIPVYNDSQRLKICLKALFTQTFDKEKYEVIVVDNASIENIKEVCEQFKTENITYLYEKKKGSYAARNKGIKYSKSKYKAFVDSDCIPQKDWLQKAVRILEKGNMDLLGGKVELFFKEPNNPTDVELYEGCFAFQQERNIKRKNVSITANLFVKTKVFNKTGLFDDSLLSGGDTEFCKRANKNGFNIEYAPNVVVLHPARNNWEEMRDKLLRVVGGKYSVSKPKLFLKTILLMPIYKLYMVLSTAKYTLREKFKIIKIIFLRQFVIIEETIKLIFGKDPER